MNDIKDILRQRHGLGLTGDRIAAANGVSACTVSHVLERAAAAGLSWPLPDDLDDDELRARLYPPPGRHSRHAQPDWDAVIEELNAPRKRRRARLTRRRRFSAISYAVPGAMESRWSVSVSTVIDGVVFTVFVGLRGWAGCREAVGASSGCATPPLRCGLFTRRNCPRRR